MASAIADEVTGPAINPDLIVRTTIALHSYVLTQEAHTCQPMVLAKSPATHEQSEERISMSERFMKGA